SSSAAAAAGTAKPSDKPAGAAPQSAASPASASSASAKPPPSSGSSGAKPKPGDLAPGTKQSGRRTGGGVISHLTAGVLGGAMAYAGAALLGPAAQPPGQTGAELEARIETVEKALRETSDLSA